LHVSDGSHTANLALFGIYASTSFALASDGNGGTLVTNVATLGASAIAAAPLQTTHS
jgi:hypothetical protein